MGRCREDDFGARRGDGLGEHGRWCWIVEFEVEHRIEGAIGGGRVAGYWRRWCWTD